MNSTRWTYRLAPFLALAVVALVALAPAFAAGGPTPGSLRLIGSNPLLNRGMNAALAVNGDYAYIGSRTDGSHPNAGVLVVDVSDPSAPEVVNQIGPPNEAVLGATSRELRVWPRQRLLLVLDFGCDPVDHLCLGAVIGPPAPTIRFYDIRAANARDPKLVATYRPSRLPHEFFLWQDPKARDRALLYMSINAEDGEQLLVTDISAARRGRFRELASFAAPINDPDAGGPVALHSLSVSPNGKRGYLAYLAGGFLMVDTSDLALDRQPPMIRLLTPVRSRAHWGAPGAHSAVPLFGSDHALTTDEVYGDAFGMRPEGGGCPWGWSRVIEIVDPARPQVVAEYKLHPFNDHSYCGRVSPLRNAGASYSPHNPTVTRRVAFITWHSGGLQAVSLADPRHPAQLAEFRPRPLPAVVTEDPNLSMAPQDKVVFWSYPIIKEGLIYVVDVRNGLYVLRYSGPQARGVRCLRFLEGNSNLGWPPRCRPRRSTD